MESYKQATFYTAVKVYNLSPETTPQTLVNFFGLCGDIVSLRLSTVFNNTRWAVVDFGSPAPVENAVIMSHSVIDGRLVTVSEYFLTHTDCDDTETLIFGHALPTYGGQGSVLAETVDAGKEYLGTVRRRLQEYDAQHGISDAVKRTAGEVDAKLHLTDLFNRGKTFTVQKFEALDRQYNLSGNVSATCARIDDRLGLSQTVGTVKRQLRERYGSRDAEDAFTRNVDTHEVRAVVSDDEPVGGDLASDDVVELDLDAGPGAPRARPAENLQQAPAQQYN